MSESRRVLLLCLASILLSPSDGRSAFHCLACLLARCFICSRRRPDIHVNDLTLVVRCVSVRGLSAANGTVASAVTSAIQRHRDQASLLALVLVSEFVLPSVRTPTSRCRPIAVVKVEVWPGLVSPMLEPKCGSLFANSSVCVARTHASNPSQLDVVRMIRTLLEVVLPQSCGLTASGTSQCCKREPEEEKNSAADA